MDTLFKHYSSALLEIKMRVGWIPTWLQGFEKEAGYIIKRRRYTMKFQFKIWVLTITIDLFDLDPSDGSIGLGIFISWK